MDDSSVGEVPACNPSLEGQRQEDPKDLQVNQLNINGEPQVQRHILSQKPG